MFEATYVINLDRTPDRWAHAREVCAQAGLPNVIRFRGVDGRRLNADAVSDLQNRGLLATGEGEFDDASRAGELGCALSHSLVLDDIIGRGWRSALILEDDVDLAGDPSTWSDRLDAAYRDLPASWELWYLYRCLDIQHRVRRVSPRTVVPWTPQGCAAYAVTATGARIIRDATRPVGNAVDRVLMNVVKTRRIKAFAASPMLVDPGQMASLINTQPGQRTWVDNGVNRPPEYWPEEYLAHLGERVPDPPLHLRLWRAGSNAVQQVLRRPKGVT